MKLQLIEVTQVRLLGTGGLLAITVLIMMSSCHLANCIAGYNVTMCFVSKV